MEILKFTVFLALLNLQIGRLFAVSFLEDTTLTKNEARLLEKFKTQMQSRFDHEWMKNDNMFLVQFLRAKNFDIGRAKDFLNTHLNWRKENGMDTIHDEDWSDFTNDYYYNLDGTDREGRVLVRCDFGDWDVRKAVIAGKLPRLIRYTMKMWDEARIKVNELAREGKNVTRWTMIIDLNNFNVGQHLSPQGMSLYLTAAASYDSQFPNMGDDIYLLNTPGLFESVLALVRPILKEATRKALKVYGKNPSLWGPIVRDRIDPSQLPPRYGGTEEERARFL